MNNFLKYFFYISFIFSMFSCDSNSAQNIEEELSVVPPGKADNFYSDTAQEYSISGTMIVELEDEDLSLPENEKLDKVSMLAQLKTSMLMAYLNEYVIDKSEHSSHPDFGGLHAMARAAAFEAGTISMDSTGIYSFEFNGEIGGSLDFIDLVEHDTSQPKPEGGKVLKFGIPLMSSGQLENETWKSQYSTRPSSWDPATQSPEDVDYISVTIIPEEISGDSYLNYNALFADGELTIGIHFGYDYNDKQYDILESKQVFDRLNSWGFKSPVSKFEDLKIDSPPFTKTIIADNKDIEVKIKLVYANMVNPSSDAVALKNSLIESFKTREVILFNGHAGFSGRFLPANWQSTSSGNISSEEMWEMDLPQTYQIVLVNGCDTFGKFIDNFRLNPSKHDSDGNLINVDVVTTTSFSWLSQWGDVSLKFVEFLTGGYSTNVKPQTWDRLLSEINWGVNSSVFFGISGIDNDPKIHPYANQATQCNECSRHADCGNSLGNKCVKMIDNKKYCVMTCLDDSGCPSDYTCQKVSNTSYILSKQCIPASLTCTISNPDTSDFSLIINEVLADPAPDMTGDANHDGNRSATEDEFVELVNISDSALNISGWTVSDGMSTRFTFPQSTTIPSGGVVLVFGGGNPETYSWPTNVNVFTSDEGLFLNNSGDSVFISNNRGELIDSMSYTGQDANDRSLTRSIDKDPSSSFIPHPDQSHSAGYAQDGSEL